MLNAILVFYDNFSYCTYYHKTISPWTSSSAMMVCFSIFCNLYPFAKSYLQLEMNKKNVWWWWWAFFSFSNVILFPPSLLLLLISSISISTAKRNFKCWENVNERDIEIENTFSMPWQYLDTSSSNGSHKFYHEENHVTQCLNDRPDFITVLLFYRLAV